MLSQPSVPPSAAATAAALIDYDLSLNYIRQRNVIFTNFFSHNFFLCQPDFSENDFTGHLPTVAIKNLPDLQKFHVHQSGRAGTGIVGQLPSFKEQKQLHLLDVSSNS